MIDNLLFTLSLIHFFALGGLALYGVHRLWLVRIWARERCRPHPPRPTLPEDPALWPLVTVQLPLYNERFVARRLIDAAARLDWPAHLLEIQVLDDSNDDTSGIVDDCAAHWQMQGINVRILRRSQRTGYKAGALAHGLRTAKGEFLAVFDADFIPTADFLRQTVPCFADSGIGMVQARWEFLNAEYSWLTRVQSLLLGPHFGIEHFIRCRRGLFFNFNGTAGIWRRSAIDEAGGWQADTVTEDLDLSYRAQLAGWHFLYLDDYAVPSELPATLADFRSQQQRWAKGSIQTAKKLLPTILCSPLPLKVKTEAIAHLLANLGWLLGAIVTFTLYPTILWRTGIGPYQLLRLDLPLFLGASVAIMVYFLLYAVSQRERQTLPWLPLLPILAIGLAPCLALSVMHGFLSRGGDFVRTPKFGLLGRQEFPVLAPLYRQVSFRYLGLNLLFLGYSLLPVLFSWQQQTWYAVPFLSLFPFAYSLIIFQECVDSLGARRRYSIEAVASPTP